MVTQTVRVPEDVHAELQAAARLTGAATSDLLARAWQAYRESPDFAADLDRARADLAAGDLQSIAARLADAGRARAAARAARVRALREQNP